MFVPTPSAPESAERAPDSLARLGGWLFKRRTVIPLPVAAALLLISPSWFPSPLSTSMALVGVPVVALGELLRVWGVHHIGVISRTRSERLGPLVASGPFSLVRNPLYLGNILLWLGFTVSARLLWLAPLVVALLAIEYHAIVRWEEGLLESRIGQPYRDYMARVPRWLPLLRSPERLDAAAAFSWQATLYSERGTLMAIAVGYLLLWAKPNA